AVVACAEVASPVGCVVALEGASGFAGRTESTSVLRCNGALDGDLLGLDADLRR
ncbi:MAG: hypothetical protein QOD24_3606, partial [Solirubrobacteraceae bacterium]|nr:hypothetical protein [Solirubrobacteraceae bacterium]